MSNNSITVKIFPFVFHMKDYIRVTYIHRPTDNPRTSLRLLGVPDGLFVESKLSCYMQTDSQTDR